MKVKIPKQGYRMKSIIILMSLAMAFNTGLLISAEKYSTNSPKPEIIGKWTEVKGVFSGKKNGTLKYSEEFKSAKLSFEIKAKSLKKLFFTNSGVEANVFGFAFESKMIHCYAWNDSPATRARPLFREDFTLPDGLWIPVKIEYKGKSVILEIGDVETGEYYHLEDASYDKQKKGFSINFKGEELAVRRVKFEKLPDSK